MNNNRLFFSFLYLFVTKKKLRRSCRYSNVEAYLFRSINIFNDLKRTNFCDGKYGAQNSIEKREKKRNEGRKLLSGIK